MKIPFVLYPIICILLFLAVLALAGCADDKHPDPMLQLAAGNWKPVNGYYEYEQFVKEN